MSVGPSGTSGAATNAIRPGRAVALASSWLFVNLIRLYRVALSPLFAGACRFQPSCSHYAEEAIHIHGPARGILLVARRLLRCHPFGGSGYDGVPAPTGPRKGN